MENLFLFLLILLIIHSMVAAALARLIMVGTHPRLWKPLAFCLLGLEAVVGTVGIVLYIKGDVSWTLL